MCLSEWCGMNIKFRVLVTRRRRGYFVAFRAAICRAMKLVLIFWYSVFLYFIVILILVFSSV